MKPKRPKSWCSLSRHGARLGTIVYIEVLEGPVLFPVCLRCLKKYEAKGHDVSEMAEDIVLSYISNEPAFGRGEPAVVGQ